MIRSASSSLSSRMGTSRAISISAMTVVSHFRCPQVLLGIFYNIWLYMFHHIYDYIWLYMIIYDYIWLYMIIYDYICATDWVVMYNYHQLPVVILIYYKSHRKYVVADDRRQDLAMMWLQLMLKKWSNLCRTVFLKKIHQWLNMAKYG